MTTPPPTYADYHREAMEYGLPTDGFVDSYVKSLEKQVLDHEAYIEEQRLLLLKAKTIIEKLQ
jgi:hypothetical protein